VARTTALLAIRDSLAVGDVVAVWMTLNLLAGPFGYRALDPPPLSLVGSAVSLASLYIVVLILATQRREDQLTQRVRTHLELAILSEQKTAKIIQLLEESRGIIRRCTIAMIPKPKPWLQPADPGSVLVASENPCEG